MFRLLYCLVRLLFFCLFLFFARRLLIAHRRESRFCVLSLRVGAFLTREEKALLLTLFPVSDCKRLGRHFRKFFSLIRNIVSPKFHGDTAAPEKNLFFQVAL